MNPRGKDYVYKKRITTGQKEITDYEWTCDKTGKYNATAELVHCYNKEIGSHYVPTYEYVDFDFSEITKGELVVGVFTKVSVGEHTEWIPTIAGKRIEEWGDFIGASRYEYYTTGDTDSTGVMVGRIIGQTFTVGTVGVNADFNLIGVGMKVYKVGVGQAGYNITVYEMQNGSTFNKSISTNISIDATAYTTQTSGKWTNVSMPITTLKKNGIYCLAAFITGGEVDWRIDPTGSYAGGGRIASTDAGATYTLVSTTDMMFEVWGALTTDLSVSTTLLAPPDDTSSINTTYDFQSSSTIIGTGNFSNATLRIWNSGGTLYKTNTSTIFGVSNQTNISMNNLAVGSGYLWNVLYCAVNSSSTICAEGAANRTLSVSSFTETNQLFNYTSYETDRETFYLNLTGSGSILTANLIYNGTDYGAGTNSGNVSALYFAKTINIPTIGSTQENHTFWWQVSDGTTNSNSTFYNQSVHSTNFTLVGEGGGNKSYLNFTFKDDDTELVINGTIDTSTFTYYLGNGGVTKSYSYNKPNTVNISYAFGLVPTHKNVKANYTLQYSLTGYPQRRHVVTSAILTNGSTDTTLYLLAAADGSYSTYQVQTSAGSVVQGVSVTAERQFSGVWTTIEQGTTGGDGTVTFWLNPDYDHRLTFTKTSYATVTKTIRPTQSTYTITMSSSSGDDASYTDGFEGIKWVITPASGRLDPSTLYTFGFNVTNVSKSNLDGCRLRLLNSSGSVFNSTTGCTSTGGYISVTLTTPSDGKIWGEYALDVGSGYVVVDSDSMWVLITFDHSGTTLWDAFDSLRGLDEFGSESGRQEFTRIVLFFFVIFLMLSSICYSTGWDFSTGGGGIILVTLLILMASFPGFLELSNLSNFALIDKYFVAMITSFFAGGWLLNNWRRHA